MESIKRRMMHHRSEGAGVMLSTPDKQDKEQITDDLEQLIKTNGDDIEYEFFIAGEQVPAN
jgi:hypothetical protein